MGAVSTGQHQAGSPGRAQCMPSFSLRTSSFLKCHEMYDFKRDLHTLSPCYSVFICPRHPHTHPTLNARLFVTLASPGCYTMVGSAAVEDLAFGRRGAGLRAQSLADMSIVSHVLHVRYLPCPDTGRGQESRVSQWERWVPSICLFCCHSGETPERPGGREGERKQMSEERMGVTS